MLRQMLLERLFEKADFYFDINHESEIVSAVQKAFLNNHLIFAFKETLHNARYVAKEHIYPMEQADALIGAVKAAMGNTKRLKAELEAQHKVAMLETKEAYLGI